MICTKCGCTFTGEWISDLCFTCYKVEKKIRKSLKKNKTGNLRKQAKKYRNQYGRAACEKLVKDYGEEVSWGMQGGIKHIRELIIKHYPSLAKYSKNEILFKFVGADPSKYLKAKVRRKKRKAEYNKQSNSFLSSYAWRKLRYEAILKFGKKCQCCGASAEDGIVLNVDHIKPRKTHPELALVLDNLQVLCNVCNHGKGNWDDTDHRPEIDAHPEGAIQHMESIKNEGR